MKITLDMLSGYMPRETYGRVCANTRKLRDIAGRISVLKARLRAIDRRLLSLGTISLGTVDTGIRYLESMKGLLRSISRLKAKAAGIRESIKADVLPARKAYDTAGNKSVKLVLTVDEALRFLKEFTEIVKNRPEGAKRLEVGIDAGKLY